MERKITIEEEGIYREDYQMRMLKENHIEGLLAVKGRGADGKSYYDYDVSGKVSMKAMYEKSEIKGEDICCFLERLLAVIGETRKHLLNIHRIVVNPEYIFYESGKYYFCYYPPGTDNLWEAFHTMTEYFVKRADYKDQDCVQMIFLLHKETMEENYSLEKLVPRCLGMGKRKDPEAPVPPGYACTDKDKGVSFGREEALLFPEYDKEEHDWIAEQELGCCIMEETENMWTPVKRFLSRHKKSKWGDWDGLYIEEEEL